MSNFEVYPAIDLRGGKVVRLSEGDPNRQTVYGDDPAQTAAHWIAAGARWLHVVNLDGAFEAADQQNLRVVQAILSVTQPIGIKLQLGGGIRTLTDIEILLELGVTRAILGTVAVTEPTIVPKAIERFGPEHVVVGIDAREGIVKVRGWQEETLLTPVGLGRRLKAAGIETVIFTNIARDGLQHGVDVTSTQQLAQETGLQVIASGGVATLDDIRAVKTAGLSGVIVGRALYENNFTLEEALQC